MRNPLIDTIAVVVSILTLALMYQKYVTDNKMAEEQKELKVLQAELYKQQIAQLKNV